MTTMRVGSGIRVRKKFKAVEEKQRKKQVCPFCKAKGVRRLAKGIWKCRKCGKKIASGTFYIE